MALTIIQQDKIKKDCNQLIESLINNHLGAYSIESMLLPDTLKKFIWLKNILENELNAGLNHCLLVNYNYPSSLYHCKKEFRWRFTEMLVHPNFLI